jgi:hypothetical protein
MAHHSRRNLIKRAGTDKCQNSLQPLIDAEFSKVKTRRRKDFSCRAKVWRRRKKAQNLSADKRELTLIIFRRTLPLMASSVHQQIVDSLQRLWLNDLCSWLTGFSAGKGRTRAANEDVSRN